MHMRPNLFPDEPRDPVRDPRQGRAPARVIHEGPIQVHAIGAKAVSRPCPEGLDVQDRNEDDPTLDLARVDLMQEPLDRRRPLVFIPMR